MKDISRELERNAFLLQRTLARTDAARIRFRIRLGLYNRRAGRMAVKETAWLPSLVRAYSGTRRLTICSARRKTFTRPTKRRKVALFPWFVGTKDDLQAMGAEKQTVSRTLSLGIFRFSNVSSACLALCAIRQKSMPGKGDIVNPFARYDAYVLVDPVTGEVLYLLDDYAKVQVYKLHGRGYYSTFTVLDLYPDYAATLKLPTTDAEILAARTAYILLRKQYGEANLYPRYVRQEYEATTERTNAAQ